MSKDKKFELKYVYMAIIMTIFLVAGSFYESHNYLDALYLIFLFICGIRYLIICKTNRN